MKIYIDLLFFQDTLVTIILLFMASKMFRIKIKFLRAMIASITSSIAGILILIYLPTLYDNLFIKILFAFLCVKYVYKLNDNVETFQKLMLIFILASLLGGVTLFFDGFNIPMLIVAGIVMIFFYNYNQNSKRNLLVESTKCKITIPYKKEFYRFEALVDTGHNVKTIYGENVIFIREDIWKGGSEKNRLVSFKTISGKEIREGTKIKNIEILYNKKKIHCNAVIVATPNIVQNFEAIVGYDLIEGGMTNGNFSFNETESKEAIS